MDLPVLDWPEMLTSTICPRPALQFADWSGARRRAGREIPPTHVPEKATNKARGQNSAPVGNSNETSDVVTLQITRPGGKAAAELAATTASGGTHCGLEMQRGSSRDDEVDLA
eukprot:gene30812-40990_t